jgi:alanyl-tRNA synthetase
MIMTDRLYYHDSFLYDFDARVVTSVELSGRHAIVLDRTAFYPTSGGQVHDTGNLVLEHDQEVPVTEVAEDESGRIVHYTAGALPEGTSVRGRVNAPRRRDHMQQHSGQHVLSAAFIRLFNMPTVSFHMGVESCTIDLGTAGVSPMQVEQAEGLANDVASGDRPVAIRFVALEEARQLGVRKLPPKQSEQLRLIDIRDFDLTACGGTHVCSTGQIGAILVRKIEKVKQGVRLEFVCGGRAVTTARRDYATLTEAAGIYSSYIYDVPQQIRKSVDENKAAAKTQHRLLEELAALHAEQLLAQASGSPRLVIQTFADRDALFIKLLAQKLTAGQSEVVVLLAAGLGQAALVFAQSPRQKSNMGQLMREAMAQLGGRGGGSADMAQGGLPPGSVDLAAIEKILRDTAARL